MKSLKNLLIVLLALLISFSVKSFSFAETAPVKKEVSVKKQVTQSPLCDCLKVAIDSIQKAYVTIEEDEWPAAIKTIKATIATIDALSKTCACPEIKAYQEIAKAYLEYAEGSDRFDGADEPDCLYVKKRYSDAISLLNKYIPEITDPAVQENAKGVKEDAEEEERFVEEECGETQPQEESKGAGETTKEKKK